MANNYIWTRRGTELNLDHNLWESIVNLMDDDKREEAHLRVAPCTDKEFLEEYLKLDPEFEEVLWMEFDIERI